MEIKFRAWDKKNKGFINGFNMIGFSTGQGVPVRILQRFNTQWKMEDVELMQYTGITDKNGVRIYDKDILKVDNGCEMVARVVFLNSSWMIQPEGRGGTDIYLSDYEFNDYEVIGNTCSGMKDQVDKI